MKVKCLLHQDKRENLNLGEDYLNVDYFLTMVVLSEQEGRTNYKEELL